MPKDLSVDNGSSVQHGITKILVRGSGVSVAYLADGVVELTIAGVGLTGVQGVTGVHGVTGVTGATGPQGVTGVTGP